MKLKLLQKFLKIFQFILFFYITKVSCQNIEQLNQVEAESLIKTLNLILQPFSDCFVNIINYKSVDLDDFKIPIFLIKYFTFNYGQFPAEIIKTKNLTKGSKPNWPTFHPGPRAYRLKCSVMFYLFPPYEKSFLRAPGLVKYFWGPSVPDKEQPYPFVTLNGVYRILVEHPNYTRAIWIRHLKYVERSTPINAIVYTLNINGQTTIQKIELLCWTCHLCITQFIEFPLIHSVKKPNSLRKILDEKLQILMQMNIGGPWKMIDASLPLKDELMPDYYKLANSLEKGIVKFRNVEKWVGNDKNKIEFILFLLGRANMSFRFGDADFRATRELIPEGPSNLHIPMSYFELSPRSIFFNRKSQFFTFVACGKPEKSFINFQGFVSAYYYEIWICIVVSCGTLSFFTLVIQRFSNTEKKVKPSNFEVYSAGFKILLEQGVSGIFSEGRSSQYFLYGSWMIAAVVLTNAYKGNNITQLTAPISPVLATTFKQLVDQNFTIYDQIDYNRTTYFYIYQGGNIYTNTFLPLGTEMYNKSSITKDRCNAKYNLLSEGYGFGAYKFYTSPRGKFSDLINKTRSPFLPSRDLNESLNYLQTKLYEKVTYYPNCEGLIAGNITYSDIVSECNQVAYVDWDHIIDEMEIKVIKSKPQGFISKGKENYLAQTIGWRIERWRDNRLIYRLQWLTESGIVDVWRNVFDIKRKYQSFKSESKYAPEVKALQIEDNVSTIFLLAIFCLGLSIISGVIELRKIIALYLKSYFRKLRFFTKKYFRRLINKFGKNRRVFKIHLRNYLTTLLLTFRELFSYLFKSRSKKNRKSRFRAPGYRNSKTRAVVN